MILVQNPLRRLSGSKLFFLLASLSLVIGCKPKVRVLQAPDRAETPDVKDVDDKRIDEDKAPDARLYQDIALLLPFQLDKARNVPSNADIKRAALALDFYQGFQLGLNAVAKRGIDFRLNVVDTRDDAHHTQQLSHQELLQQAMLVVGPVYPKEIKAFGDAVSSRSVLQISPLAASAPSDFNNPNLVTITAPLSVHVDVLAARIAERYRSGDGVLLYETSDESNQRFLSLLKTSFRKNHPKLIVQHVVNHEELVNGLRQSGNNFVVCGSTNRFQLLALFDHLRLAQDGNSKSIQLFGHPNWDKLDLGEAADLGQFNTCITSSYYIDASASAVRDFDRSYQQEFQVKPTEYAYKGYDAAQYFGLLIEKHGADYAKYLQTATYDGLHNSFQFEHNATWGYVNTSLRILEFRNGRFQPIR